MDLYILRHGVAEKREAWTEDDSLRPLTKEGEKKLRHIAQGMKRLGLKFDHVLTSPYTRAHETAKIVAKELKLKKSLTVLPALASEGEPRKVIAELAVHQDQWESVLVVGHEPYLSKLISVLSYGNTTGGIAMRKGGLCRLSCGTLRYGHCATLEWLIPPKVFEKLR